ncbi:4'-phosphopantetheinyl transferase family protein [Lacisediminihabitans profunda]|uniref:4'-phosphopantetheinyl transferase superfamily protein n=1 Tax=Lacisediminihabitans profunda TaxID=2594790 RepID=A0A5C8UX85_9MICO|nr:4'-phosphopantetheinyl transferase superfamily protein [Lacisediminihabitans profunda]TXN32690.1 4'-phosphopantetheinyl transferase superfamily protein [Lacisediminihabitans profunda]
MREAGRGPTRVWIACVDDELPAIAAGLGLPHGDSRQGALLDPDERARASSFVDPLVSARFSRAHAVLRLVLGSVLAVEPALVSFRRGACPACGGPHGRPQLAHPPGPEFSLSRTGAWVAVAVREGAAVGVDIEVRRSDAALAPLERDILAAGEAVTGDILDVWVRKEALLKATGLGLSREMSTVHLLPRAGGWLEAGTPGMVVRDLVAGPTLGGAIAGPALGEVEVLVWPTG